MFKANKVIVLLLLANLSQNHRNLAYGETALQNLEENTPYIVLPQAGKKLFRMPVEQFLQKREAEETEEVQKESDSDNNSDSLDSHVQQLNQQEYNVSPIEIEAMKYARQMNELQDKIVNLENKMARQMNEMHQKEKQFINQENKNQQRAYFSKEDQQNNEEQQQTEKVYKSEEFSERETITECHGGICLIKECVNNHCYEIKQNNTPSQIHLSKSSQPKPKEQINASLKAAPKAAVLKKQDQNVSQKVLLKSQNKTNTQRVLQQNKSLSQNNNTLLFKQQGNLSLTQVENNQSLNQEKQPQILVIVKINTEKAKIFEQKNNQSLEQSKNITSELNIQIQADSNQTQKLASSNISSSAPLQQLSQKQDSEKDSSLVKNGADSKKSQKKQKKTKKSLRQRVKATTSQVKTGSVADMKKKSAEKDDKKLNKTVKSVAKKQPAKKELAKNNTSPAKKLIKQNITLSDYVQQNSNIKEGTIIKPASQNLKNFTIGSTKGTIELLQKNSTKLK